MAPSFTSPHGSEPHVVWVTSTVSSWMDNTSDYSCTNWVHRVGCGIIDAKFMHVQPHYHYLVLTVCKLARYSSGVIGLLQVCLSNNKKPLGHFTPGTECKSELFTGFQRMFVGNRGGVRPTRSFIRFFVILKLPSAFLECPSGELYSSISVSGHVGGDPCICHLCFSYPFVSTLKCQPPP